MILRNVNIFLGHGQTLIEAITIWLLFLNLILFRHRVANSSFSWKKARHNPDRIVLCLFPWIVSWRKSCLILLSSGYVVMHSTRNFIFKLISGFFQCSFVLLIFYCSDISFSLFILLQSGYPFSIPCWSGKLLIFSVLTYIYLKNKRLFKSDIPFNKSFLNLWWIFDFAIRDQILLFFFTLIVIYQNFMNFSLKKC